MWCQIVMVRQTLTTADDKVQETDNFRPKSAVYCTLVDALKQALFGDHA